MAAICGLKAFLLKPTVTLVDLVALLRQLAALPEGARHIDLLTEVVHRLLEQFELIHVELLLLLACSLGSHAPAR